MNKLKSAGFCFFVFAFYYLLAFFVCLSGATGLSATIITNVLFSVVAFVYYKFCINRQTDNDVSTPALVVFVVFLAVIWFFSQVTATAVYNIFSDPAYDTYHSVTSSDSVLYVILTLVIAPVTEELFLRGIIYNRLRNAFGGITAYAVSALLFALMHGTLVHLFLGISTGLFFAFIYTYTGKLRYSIAYHSLFNAMSIVFTNVSVPDTLYSPVVFVSTDFIILWIIVMLAKTEEAERRSPLRLDLRHSI